MDAEGYKQFEADINKLKEETQDNGAKAMLDLAIDLLHNCRDSGLEGLGESDALSKVKNITDAVEFFNKETKDGTPEFVEWMNKNY